MFTSEQVTTLSDEVLQRLASALRDGWTFLGLQLGYEMVHLQEYYAMAESSGNLPSYCMLKGWQSGLRPDVDEVKVLKKALHKMKRGELTNMLPYVLHFFKSICVTFEHLKIPEIISITLK